MFTSCTSIEEPIPTPPDPNPDPNPIETAYISFAIDPDTRINTRAFDEVEGSAVENYVKKVRVVLYDGDLSESEVVKCFDFQIETSVNGQYKWKDNSPEQKDLAPTDNLSEKTNFTTYARKVPLMDLQMLVIINPTEEINTITNEGIANNYGLIKDMAYLIETEKEKLPDVGGLAADKYFLMTSGPGLIPVKKDQLCGSVRDAHTHPIEAIVSRVVSKVTVAPHENGGQIITKTDAEIDDITWELDITNRYTYWTGRGYSGEDRNTWYGEDPNYSDFGSKDLSERSKHFFYYTLTDDDRPALTKKLNASEYCLENTMNLADQEQENVITRALIRCIYKPVNVETIGESFYVFNNNTYSIQDMKAFAEEAAKTPTSLLKGLYKAIVDAGQYDFLSGVPKENGEEVTEPFSVEGIVYYPNGVNYYAIKILHFGIDDKDLKEGQYGVMRNTHYIVHINEINGPGSPTILWDDINTRSTEKTNNSLYKNIDASINIQSK